MATILFVDDIPEQLDSIVEYFQYVSKIENITIHKALNVNEAEQLINGIYESGGKVDVIVTDMMMEQKDSGVRILQLCHAIDPTIVTILYTANESKLNRMSIFDYGAFEVIEKNMIDGDSSDEIVLKVQKALEYKRRLEYSSVLKTHLDPSIAAQIEKTGSIPLSSRMATIAFWDIRGFSKLCEQLSENLTLISEFVSEYNAVAVQTIKKYDGILDKFIGDGIMAIFLSENETESSIENASLNAVKCGMALSEEFEKISRKHSEKWRRYIRGEINFSLGCGIHTGKVLFGELGNSDRRNITAIGAHVNFAARIEGSSSNGDIIISQTTHSWCAGKIIADSFITLSDIKNIPGEYEIFKVHGLKP